MALARIKTWLAGDVLTAADLNAEFNNILSNPFPLINTMPSAAGDLFVSTGVNTWGRLAIGTSGQVLQVSTGLVPVWGTFPSSGTGQFTLQYVSSDITLTFNTGTTLAHGLGVAPKFVRSTLKLNSSAVGGYSTGDEVDVYGIIGETNAAVAAISVASNATNVSFLIGNAPVISNKTTPATILNISTSAWVGVVRAWA